MEQNTGKILRYCTQALFLSLLLSLLVFPETSAASTPEVRGDHNSSPYEFFKNSRSFGVSMEFLQTASAVMGSEIETNPGLTRQNILLYMLLFLFLLLLLLMLIGAFVWSWSLKHQVHRRTIELQTELTKRQHAESTLAEEHNLLRTKNAQFLSLLQAISDSVYFKDVDGRNIIVNKAFEDFTGLSSEEIVGQKDEEILPAELAEQCKVSDQIVLNTQRPLRIEQQITGEDGEISFFETIKAPMFDEEGNLLGLVGVSRDATERKRAEEALRLSEKKFSAAFHSSPVAMTIVSLNDGRYIDVNDSFLRMYGYERKEIIGSTIFRVNLWVNTKQRKRLAQTIREQGAIRNFEFSFRHKSGKLGIGLLSAEVITMNEEALVLVSTNDITNQKRAEEALVAERALLAQKVSERTAELSKANAELARAARLKDEFLANMSHELRTPLNSILGMSEALQEEVYGPLNEKQFNAIHTINESGRHLLTLINDILDLSKIGAGKMDLDIHPISVERVCQAGLRLIRQNARKKHLKIRSLFDSNVTTIQADERRLKQILVNLLSNAVKFTPEGGEIGLEVQGDPEHRKVHFTIWDTGIGIAKDDMKRLFHPFTQLDARLSRKYNGTGLGLSLVYRLAELHHGSISVESEVNKGSRFTVSLPWQEVDIPSLPPLTGESIPSTINNQQSTINNQ